MFGRSWYPAMGLIGLSACILVGGGIAAADEQSESGIRLPAGFRVQLYAGDDLAHDIHSLTLDSRGRVVVSGPGYIRILEDVNGDGRADSALPFSDRPASGSQGMYFHGTSLLCAGDEGLLIFRDENGDGRADGAPQTFLKIAAGGEHHVHSIQRGPDGWWYVMAGNYSGVTGAYATSPASPIRVPVSGTLLRLTPELRGGEIVADGFRNSYDFAFGMNGDLFTWDSDDERDISLPWYLPTQVYHVLPGANAGYVSAGLKRPGSYADAMPVLAGFGRGSPTGVLCYRHEQFPAAYRGGLFVQDWTYGRILYLPLHRAGGGWGSEPQEFAAGTNQFGFAPTDMEVGPDGSLYVSVGGRGTRGGVYRIWWAGESGEPSGDRISREDGKALRDVLRALQPNTAWSRARWVPAARGLRRSDFETAAVDQSLSEMERVRAIEVAVELHGGLSEEVISVLSEADSALVRARAAWALGRMQAAEPNVELLRRYFRDADPIVRRFAWESLSGAGAGPIWDSIRGEISKALGDDDRLVRLSAALLIGRMTKEQQSALEAAAAGSLRSRLWFYLGQQQRRGELSVPALRAGVEVLEAAVGDSELRREAVRLLQLGLSDMGPMKGRAVMFDGYARRVSPEAIERELNPLLGRLFGMLPSGDPDLDRELIRFFAMTAPLNHELLTQLLRDLTDESSPQEDIHRLTAISRIDLERSYAETERTCGVCC